MYTLPWVKAHKLGQRWIRHAGMGQPSPRPGCFLSEIEASRSFPECMDQLVTKLAYFHFLSCHLIDSVNFPAGRGSLQMALKWILFLRLGMSEFLRYGYDVSYLAQANLIGVTVPDVLSGVHGRG